jgi:hypothetical protein
MEFNSGLKGLKIMWIVDEGWIEVVQDRQK